jgi:hypothetical protein
LSGRVGAAPEGDAPGPLQGAGPGASLVGGERGHKPDKEPGRAVPQETTTKVAGPPC